MNNTGVPSRWNYAIAVVILLAGVGFSVYVIFTAVIGLDKELQQFLVPGEKELILSRPGHYTVFHERRSTFQGRVFDVGELPGLRSALTRKDDGREVPLRSSSANQTYSFGSREGVSVLDFDIDRPGTYVFRAWYPDENGPEAVFAVGREFMKGLFAAIANVCGINALAFAISLFLIVWTAIRRSRAQRTS